MTDENSSILFSSTKRLAEGLRLAREACGKSIKECSQLLDIPTSRLRNYENGKYVPSLPEIETLSYIYNIPLYVLFAPDLLPEFNHDPSAKQLRQLLEIRLRVIATSLQLAREKSGKSYKELARETSISTSRLKKYEKGETSIAFNDLQKLTKALDIDLDSFFDKESPIGQWQELITRKQSFGKLPQEIQSFALSQENQPFIKFTQKVKAVGIENLVNLSDSIQQIVDSSDQQN